jgi:hypothetical protein
MGIAKMLHVMRLSPLPENSIVCENYKTVMSLTREFAAS